METDGNLVWNLINEAAYAKARQEGKRVFIDFYGSWCTNCKAFKAKAKSDAIFNAALRIAILLKVKDTSKLFGGYQADARFPELKVGIPFFIIPDSEERLLYKTSDCPQTEDMVLFLHE